MLKKERTSDNRVFGLDLLRAIAVLTVLVGHSLNHGTPPGWLVRILSPQGVTGVEIFYVLSGYLIGHILLRSALTGQLHSRADVIDFWKRRWARTLPLYFFFLVVYMRFDYHGILEVKQIWPFFLFLQNLAWPTPPFFLHSWSLAVEEWFYLLLPLVFVLSRRVMKSNRAAMLCTAIIFVLVPTACRIMMALKVSEWGGFDQYVRSIVLCRLDSLFIGVLCAYVRVTHPAAFAGIARFWPFSLCAVLSLAGILSINAGLISDNLVARVVYFPLLSLSIACLIPAATQLKSTGISVLDVFVSHTAKVSYSLYLGHIVMLTTMLGIMDFFGWKALGIASTAWLYVGFALLYYGFANLTYAFIEQPYIQLRNAKLGHSDVRSGAVAMNVDTPKQDHHRATLPAQTASRV